MGFAQVYLPFIKSSLGSSASFAWLILNTFAGLYLAVMAYRKFLWIIVWAYLAIALAYAVLNEGASFIAYVLAVAGVLLFAKKYKRKKQHLSNNDDNAA